MSPPLKNFFESVKNKNKNSTNSVENWRGVGSGEGRKERLIE